MSDFFEPGVEYDDATPYSAPEIIRTFRCVAVATLPGSDMPIAFGFMHSDGLGWTGTGMDPDHWAKGWNRTGAFALPSAGVSAEVWYYTNDDESSSTEVYPDADAAKDAAIKDYASEYDPAEMADGKFTWREFTPPGKDQGWWLLDHGGVFTGWSVDSIRIAAPVAKAVVR